MWFKCLFKSKQQKAPSNKSSTEQNVMPICQFFSNPCLNYMSWLGIPFATNNTLLWLWSFIFIFIDAIVMIPSLALSLKLNMSKVPYIHFLLWSPCLCMIQKCPNFMDVCECNFKFALCDRLCFFNWLLWSHHVVFEGIFQFPEQYLSRAPAQILRPGHIHTYIYESFYVDCDH